MNLSYYSGAVTFCFVICRFVSVCVTCNAVISLDVMIGMSDESWHHKSTLSFIPGPQDWACQSNSLLYNILFLAKTF